MVDSMRHWFPKNTDAVTVDFYQLESLVRRVEPEAISMFYNECPEENKADLKTLLDFLANTYPYLFHVLSQILQVFQNAREQATVVMEEYIRFYIADRALVEEYACNDYKIKKGGKPAEKKLETVIPAKKRGKKVAKRKNENNEKKETIPEDVKEEALKRMKPQVDIGDYVASSPSLDEDTLDDLVEEVKKGQIRRELKQAKWDIYHVCHSKWHAEMCLEALKYNCKEICLVKRKRGGGDRELLRYGILIKDK